MFIQNKITYLRGQYCRELSKIKEKSGRADDEPYVPSVFWYSDMRFLEKFIKKGKSSNKSHVCMNYKRNLYTNSN